MDDFRIVDVGDAVLSVEFEEKLDVALNERVVGLAERITAGATAGVIDVVPTFRTVAVYFDPLETDVAALRVRLEEDARASRASAGSDRTRPALGSRPGRLGSRPGPLGPGSTSVTHEIPVRYGGSDGPDLAAVASATGLSEEAVVRLHTAAVYRVFMLGFLPGFAYMAPIDSRIALPRLGTPRARVPVGTVAIAGRQTGIYPMESPGGWHLIGRTDVRPMEPGRSDPFLFKPGDHVRFTAIPS
jgi:inhibitor of KinA